MSQTTVQALTPEQMADYENMVRYLNEQTMPPNDFTIDPEYMNMRITTPVGRFPYIHVAAPHAIKQKDGSPGKPMFNATLLMAKGTEQHPIILDLYRAACMVCNAKWPVVQRVDPNNPNSLITVSGSDMFWVPQDKGGFHYPLREGDDSYQKDPAKHGMWRGLVFINCGMNPKTKNGIDQRPITLDEQGNLCDPSKFYPGCYGRLNITVAPFENMGNKGVTFFLNAVQFAANGPKMITGFNAESAAKNAFGKAGALPVAQPLPPAGGFGTGFGPNSASPGSIPPGVPGFAAPPPQAQPAPVYPQQQPAPVYPQAQPAPAGYPQQQPGYQPGQPIPPQPQQQPWSPAPAGARPPGV